MLYNELKVALYYIPFKATTFKKVNISIKIRPQNKVSIIKSYIQPSQKCLLVPKKS